MNVDRHPGGRLRAALGWCGQVLSWVVILGFTAIITISVLIPRIGGATPYVILTSSMQSAMPPGTLVVAKPVDPETLGVGTVITYQLNSGDPTVVTHRITEVSITSTGEYRFQTKGDANDAADAKLVRPVQVKGERWYYVPYVGYLTNLVTGSQRQVFTMVVVVGLFGYAAWMFLGAVRDRRRKATATTTVTTTATISETERELVDA
ncbi:signal peptidase I [Nocardioides sp.]|uniref:signal peptidase I n=1 Tax=Nocardioides sp. TaxID=35761 RepID=UPI003D14778E